MTDLADQGADQGAVAMKGKMTLQLYMVLQLLFPPERDLLTHCYINKG